MQRFGSLLIAIVFLSTVYAVPPGRAATKIALTYNATSAYLGAYVAKDQGFFDRHGLDVDLSLAENGTLTPAALVSESRQIGVLTPPMILQADEQGLDLVIVAGGTVAPDPSGESGLVARTGSGIQSAKDLIGRKVGVPGLGGTFDMLMKKWVESNGVDYRKVNWAEVPFTRMGDSLKAGVVDAVALINPFYTHALNGKVGYTIGDFYLAVPAGSLFTVYASTHAWARKNPETVKAFRAALDDAKSFIVAPTHVEAVRGSIAKYTKLPPQAAATIQIPVNIETHPQPRAMAFWIDVSREQGLIKEKIDPISLFAP
jgi:NitT/TauT family transport system substrate-binding protein